MSKPLEGVRVLELSTFVAAPCTGRLLADLGAEVIKIEKSTGDDWRYTAISLCRQRFTHEENPIFDIFNTGKEFISVNMKTPEGKDIFFKLLSSTDVFLTNMRLKALRRLGIEYDSLSKKYPSLVYAMITGYGDKGPDAELPAFDSTAFWSRCGFLRDNAVPTDNGYYMPAYPPNGGGDIISAYVLVSEINAALFQRKKTGRGQLVESSLYHTGIFAFASMVTANQKPFDGAYPTARHNRSLPGGSYECKDGEWIFLATSLIHIAPHVIAVAIGKPELETDERFDTAMKRWRNRKEYYSVLKPAFLTKTSAEWLAIFKSMDFPAVRINHFADVSEEEQALANGFVEKVTYPNGNVDSLPGSPFNMSSIGENGKTKPSPMPGRDTAKILKTLGYSEKEIKDLDEKGVTSVGIIE